MGALNCCRQFISVVGTEDVNIISMALFELPQPYLIGSAFWSVGVHDVLV
tara:strand:+ start:9897 stop:10046 length:150 start_codon:yes stop_codon:yes gene_type:complete